MSIENMYEIALRKKFRFSTKVGNINVEDLWDISVEQLDDIYKLLNKKRKESQETSLLNKASDADNELTTKIIIIEHIVKTKLAERDARETAAIRATKANTIKELIARKKEEELGEKSVDELAEMLNELI